MVRMSHTVLLSQLERLHNRIEMLETNMGLGVRNEHTRNVVANMSADSVAEAIIAHAKGWADGKDASELRFVPTRVQITDLKQFIKYHSAGIRKDDLSRSLHVRLQSISEYISHFVPKIWEAFYAVYGHESGR
jgi:hypothetical protein